MVGVRKVPSISGVDPWRIRAQTVLADEYLFAIDQDMLFTKISSEYFDQYVTCCSGDLCNWSINIYCIYI